MREGLPPTHRSRPNIAWVSLLVLALSLSLLACLSPGRPDVKYYRAKPLRPATPKKTPSRQTQEPRPEPAAPRETTPQPSAPEPAAPEEPRVPPTRIEPAPDPKPKYYRDLIIPRDDPYAPPKRSCCKVCRKGKPCGNSCISRNKRCHRGPGCAC